MNKWTSFAEQLPPPDRDVITKDENGEIEIYRGNRESHSVLSFMNDVISDGGIDDPETLETLYWRVVDLD